MQNTKNLKLFLIVLMVMLALVGCGKDDDGPTAVAPNSQLVGSWTLQSENGNPVSDDYLVIYTFRSDYSWIVNYSIVGSYGESNGTYTISGSIISFSGEESVETTEFNFSIVGDTLTMSNHGDTMEYVRSTW